MNNICSNTSPYYRTYIYPINRTNDIPIGNEADDKDNTTGD
jgi:hypothetical protein